jgi:hypothetical protein
MAEPNTNATQPWYARPAHDATGVLGVDPPTGLSSDEAGRRLERYGRLATALTRRTSPDGCLRYARTSDPPTAAGRAESPVPVRRVDDDQRLVR